MRVLCLATSVDNAAYRYRVGQFIAPLAGHGVDVESRVVPRDRRHRTLLFASAAAFDAVWVLRCRLRNLQAHVLRRRARRLIFEFDDAVWMRDSRRWLRLSGRPFAFRRIVRLADHVIAGNAFLAEWARARTKAVTVVPTCVDTAWYEPRQSHPPDEPADLVWIGQESTLEYLEAVLPALDRIAEQRPLRLRVISSAFPSARHVQIVRVPWREETERRELARGHIGLAPLPDHPWARGKCGLKVLQYMAAGLPVVASPVGVQVDQVGGSERGRLAVTPDEWVEQVSALLDDRAERERCGAAGRAFVEAKYSVAHWAPRIAGLLKTVAGQQGDRL